MNKKLILIDEYAKASIYAICAGLLNTNSITVVND